MEEQKEVLEKPNKKRQITQIVFLILMLAAIVGLFGSIITINKYADMLQNPMGYNMEKFGLKYCTCYDAQKRIVPIEGLSFNDSFNDVVAKPVYKNKTYEKIPDNLTIYVTS